MVHCTTVALPAVCMKRSQGERKGCGSDLTNEGSGPCRASHLQGDAAASTAAQKPETVASPAVPTDIPAGGTKG